MATPEEKTLTVFDGDYCLSDITLEDYLISTNQVNAMQRTDRGSKRNGVYLPAAIGLFGLGTLLPEEATSDCPFPRLPPSSDSPTTPKEVIQELKKRDSVVHDKVRSSLHITPNVGKAAVASMSVVESQREADITGSDTTSVLDGQRVDKRVSCALSDAGSWVSVTTPEGYPVRRREGIVHGEPRVRFSPQLTDEMEQAVSFLNFSLTCFHL